MKSTKNSEEKFSLSVQKRTVFGKKLNKLRKTGDIPANIFGPGFKSTAITVNQKDFTNIYKKAKETGIVYLQLEKDEYPTLIKQIQRHPVEDNILHIDFRKIDLTKKIETEVPIKVVGESIAVTQKGGILLTQHDHLVVTALPKDIPHEIEIDISSIKDVGEDIKVSDIAKSSTFDIKNEPETVVVSVTAHKEESIEPETTTEAAEVIGEEGKDSTEGGETAKEEGTSEEKGGGEKPKESTKDEKKEE